MKKILVLGHRGFSGKYPENTRISFVKGVTEGHCDGYESDVHLSSDGVPVVMHDQNLERTSNGKGLIGDKTWAELQKLDNGSWKGPEFAGSRILHLDELLEIVRDNKVFLNLEIKNYEIFYKNIEEIAIKHITDMGLKNQVILSSFNNISMMNTKKAHPDMQFGFLYGYPLVDMPGAAKKAGVDALHPSIKCLYYSPDLVAEAHSKGLKVNVWTVNSDEDVQFCIKQDVDAIITNYPDKVRRMVDAAGKGV
jgi:glycerophosphoryl diester phosphodiesterase